MVKLKPTARIDDSRPGEKMLHFSCLGIIGFFIVNMVLMVIADFREFLSADFPNLYFIGLHGLFIAASVRMNEAYTHGNLPLNTNSSNKKQKESREMLVGSTPNYSVPLYNTLFIFAGICFLGLMLFHLSVTFFRNMHFLSFPAF